jgi:ankyrin repeat protein
MKYFKKVIYLIVLIGYSFSFSGSYDDFFSALERDNAGQVKALLQRGFDPNSVSPKGEYALILALRQASWQVAELLIAQSTIRVEVRTPKGESPLMLAAVKGKLGLCAQLIAREADVNKPGWTPLHYAATSGNAAVVQLLLDHYAYIDAESPNGSTPLMMAAMYGSLDAVKLLLQAGADPALKNAQGLTALDFARKGQHADAVDLIAASIRGKKQEGAW